MSRNYIRDYITTRDFPNNLFYKLFKILLISVAELELTLVGLLIIV